MRAKVGRLEAGMTSERGLAFFVISLKTRNTEHTVQCNKRYTVRQCEFLRREIHPPILPGLWICPGMIPILQPAGLMIPGQLGPTKRDLLCAFNAFMTCTTHMLMKINHSTI